MLHLKRLLRKHRKLPKNKLNIALMNQDEFFQIGKVIKSSGSTGELVFILDNEKLAGKKKLESVFIQINGNLIPFFIDTLRMKSGNMAMVKLFDVHTPEDMMPLLGCALFLPDSLKPVKRPGKGYDFYLEGFRVIDGVYGDIGIVVKVLELPMQQLLEIDHGGKQILVPLVEEIVLGLDKKEKVLHIHAPEGLIEIYL
jgi:16S rRNA processing protein RimM